MRHLPVLAFLALLGACEPEPISVAAAPAAPLTGHIPDLSPCDLPADFHLVDAFTVRCEDATVCASRCVADGPSAPAPPPATGPIECILDGVGCVSDCAECLGTP